MLSLVAPIPIAPPTAIAPAGPVSAVAATAGAALPRTSKISAGSLRTIPGTSASVPRKPLPSSVCSRSAARRLAVSDTRYSLMPSCAPSRNSDTGLSAPNTLVRASTPPIAPLIARTGTSVVYDWAMSKKPGSSTGASRVLVLYPFFCSFERSCAFVTPAGTPRIMVPSGMRTSGIAYSLTVRSRSPRR